MLQRFRPVTFAKETEQIASDKRAYNPKQDIQPEALALPVDDLLPMKPAKGDIAILT